MGIIKEIKSCYNNILHKSKVSHILLFFILIMGVILWGVSLIFNINLLYLSFYFNLAFVILLLNKLISNIIGKKEITRGEFFKYVVAYLFIVGLYIFFFANLYSMTTKLGDGSFNLDGEDFPLDRTGFYFISGITFLSYEVGFFPLGYMKVFMFVQIFISQIIILGFLFIMFGKLITRLKNQKRKA